MNKKTITGLKIITINRKASFNYFFKEVFEAGIVLKGSEIKSVRLGKINIADSYAVDKAGEIFEMVMTSENHVNPISKDFGVLEAPTKVTT